MSATMTIMAALSGFVGGLLYFHMFWRSTREYVTTSAPGRLLTIQAGLRLAGALSVVGVSLALGANTLEIAAALVGFLLSRQAAMHWARRPHAAGAVTITPKGRPNAH